MDPPAPETLMRALENLHDIGAICDEGHLTDDGRKMSEFPLDPVLAKCVITSAQRFSCPQEALAIVAMLNVPNIFVRPRDLVDSSDAAKKKFSHNDGDHLTLLKAYQAFLNNGMDTDWCWKNYLNFRALKQANDIKKQLERILQQQGCKTVGKPMTHPDYYVDIRKCILSGFFMQCCCQQRGTGTYTTLKDDQIVLMHPSTVIDFKPEFVVYNEFMLTSKNYVRTCTVINPEWLFDVAPGYFDLDEFPNSEAKRRLARCQDKLLKKK